MEQQRQAAAERRRQERLAAQELRRQRAAAAAERRRFQAEQGFVERPTRQDERAAQQSARQQRLAAAQRREAERRARLRAQRQMYDDDVVVTRRAWGQPRVVWGPNGPVYVYPAQPRPWAGPPVIYRPWW